MEIFFIIQFCFCLFFIGYVIGKLNTNCNVQNNVKVPKPLKVKKEKNAKKYESVSMFDDSEDEKVNKFYK